MSLCKASERRGKAHQKHRRCECSYAQCSVGIVQDTGKPVGKQEHYRRADSAEGEECPQCDREGAAHLHLPALRVSLADHPRERHRQSGSRQHQKHAVDIVGRDKQAVSVVTEQVSDRDLVDRAEDLHYNNTGGKYRRTVQIVLFLCFSHGLSPYAYHFKT